jgi:Putative zinc-finger
VTDQFVHYDGAYVLGALEPADRQAFEEHLQTCPDCRARIEEVRPTAGLLADVPLSALDDVPMPDTLLPGLLRKAAQERRRRRIRSGSVGVVAAACITALVVLLWPSGTGTGSSTPAQALAAVRPSPVTATAQLVSRGWGTEIELHCKYAMSVNGYVPYRLVVVGTDGRAHQAGSWTLAPGGSTDFTGGTALTRSEISRVQVTLADGTPILQLRL